MPPIGRLILDSLSSRWFWILFVVLLFLGHLLQRVPNVRKPVCGFYESVVRKGLLDEFRRKLQVDPQVPTPSLDRTAALVHQPACQR